MNHPTAEIKKRVVVAYHAGNSINHLSALFGFHRNSISKWIRVAEHDSNFSRKRDPGSGQFSVLRRKFGKQFFDIILKPASFYGFETDFWTTKRIQQICKEKLRLKISRMTIHRTLKKFDYSYKKPQKRYFEACQKKQDEWVKTVLPKIRSIVKEKRAILYFEDESSINLSPVLGKTWGPIGKKIVQKVTANRGSVAAISAISSRGDLLFNICEAGKRFRADDIIRFLSDMLIHHVRRHLVVVMDQAPCHKAKKVLDFVASQTRLHLFFYHQDRLNLIQMRKSGVILKIMN
jgi:transposase